MYPQNQILFSNFWVKVTKNMDNISLHPTSPEHVDTLGGVLFPKWQNQHIYCSSLVLTK